MDDRSFWDRQRLVSATAFLSIFLGVVLAYAFRAVLPTPLGWPLWQLLLPLTAVPILHRTTIARRRPASPPK